MPEILVLHTSTHGHTATIARRIAARLRAAGAVVTEADVRGGDDPDPGDFDAVVVGGSVHNGHHQRELVNWVRHHARRLDARPGAFFSVCLAVADGTDEGRAHAREWIDDLLDDTGWTPDRVASFAGALQYREYDFATRLAMRLLMARGHHPTDTSRDHVFTDWDAVDVFAADVADLVAAGEAVA